jgi:hypothetical protein
VPPGRVGSGLPTSLPAARVGGARDADGMMPPRRGVLHVSRLGSPAPASDPAFFIAPTGPVAMSVSVFIMMACAAPLVFTPVHEPI